MTQAFYRKQFQNQLAELEKQGEVVGFWWRDDDASVPTEELTALINLSAEFCLPLTLAVIPEATGDALAADLQQRQLINVAVHGWSHRNHASKSEKKQELGDHRAIESVIKELRLAKQKLSALYPDQYVPLLVPPWNRIASSVVDQLPETGYQALSVFGQVRPSALPMVNTHIDIIDWRGSRGGRASDDLYLELTDQLKLNHSSIGILTHHLVHDSAAWEFLKDFFGLLQEHDNVRWYSSADLLIQATQR